MAVEIDIGSIKVIMDQGKFGKYVKFQRENRWICLSTTQWLKLTKYVNNVLKEDFLIKFSNDKEMKRVLYQGKHYINLCNVFMLKGTQCFKNINFNEENWQKLMENARKITHWLTNGDAPTCDTCMDIKFAIATDKYGRERETLLSNEKFKMVENDNSSVQNQLGITCTYCGRSNYMAIIDECHCHTFNCAYCSPENFCKDCKSIIVCLDGDSRPN